MVYHLAVIYHLKRQMLELPVEELLFLEDILHGIDKRTAHDEAYRPVCVLRLLLEIFLHQGESLLIVIRSHEILELLDDDDTWDIPVSRNPCRKS